MRNIHGDRAASSDLYLGGPSVTIAGKLIIAGGGPWFDVTADRFGARGNGITDDTAAIQSAIDAIPPNGGKIFFPAGSYKVTSALDLDDSRYITLIGEGASITGSAAPTEITYNGTGTMISAKSSYGITFRDMWLRFTNASHSGTLIDFAHSAAAMDSSNMRFERCSIGSGTPTIQGTGKLVSLDKAINATFYDTIFIGGNIGVSGRTASTYSNVVRFFGGSSLYFNTIPFKNAGQAWLWNGFTFQQLYPAGVTGGAGAYTQDSGVAAGTVFKACWFGDSNSTGTWIIYAGSGLEMSANYISNAATGVSIGASSGGIDITGNQFSNLTNGVVLGANCTDVDLLNSYTTVTTPETIGAGCLRVRAPRSAHASVASATNIAIPGGAKVVTITGTTAIGTITAGYAGQEVKLIFEGVVAVSDAAIKLASAYTTSADDTLSLCFNGTSWFETGRSVN